MIFRLSPESIFVRQNTWIKLFILIVGSIAAVAVPVKALYFLAAVILIYFLISPEIYKCLLKGLRIILPFMAAYSLTATVMGESLETVLVILGRIVIMVFLVTYFSASFYIRRFLEDSSPCGQHKLFRVMMFYAVATLIYIRQFASYYSETSANPKTGKSFLAFLTSRIVDSIHDNWNQRDEIQTKTELLLAQDYQPPAFLTKSNVWACIFLTILVLILAL